MATISFIDQNHLRSWDSGRVHDGDGIEIAPEWTANYTVSLHGEAFVQLSHQKQQAISTRRDAQSWSSR